MDLTLSEEHQMLKDLVRRFVEDELMPLERATLEREAAGQGAYLTARGADGRSTVSRARSVSGGSTRRRTSADRTFPSWP